MPKKPAAPDTALVAKILKLEKLRKAASAKYRQADSLNEELIAVLAGQPDLALGDGRVAVCVDNFRDRNKAFKNQYFVRYEIQILQPRPAAS